MNMLTEYYMDFAFTDGLFEGDQDGYVKFLEIAIDEFRLDFPKFRVALENKDPELFSAVKHKFSTRLSTFKLDSLSEFLQNISNSYKNDVNSVDAPMAVAELDRHYRGISDTLENKLKDIKG